MARQSQEINFSGIAVLILSAAIAIVVMGTTLIAAWQGRQLTEPAATLLSTILGAMVGAIAGYLGGFRRSQPGDSDDAR